MCVYVNFFQVISAGAWEIRRVCNSLIIFLDELGRSSGGRVETKTCDGSSQFICSMLIDHSPDMEPGFKEMLDVLNRNLEKVESFEGDVHFALSIMAHCGEKMQMFAGARGSCPHGVESLEATLRSMILSAKRLALYTNM